MVWLAKSLHGTPSIAAQQRELHAKPARRPFESRIGLRRRAIQLSSPSASGNQPQCAATTTLLEMFSVSHELLSGLFFFNTVIPPRPHRRTHKICHHMSDMSAKLLPPHGAE